MEVDLDEGFTSDKDIFQRKKFGEALFSVVSAAEEPIVLAIDAPWGEGKTVFARMWTGLIRKKGGSAVYLDAFDSDYLADPFVALASQVYELLENETPDRKKDFIELAKKTGRIATRIGVKALTGVVLDGTALEEAGVADEISDEGALAIDRVLERRIIGASEDRTTLTAFQQFLQSYAKESDSEFPLVFIVDELDRCRPDYALELLETIKHLFSAPNVVFVLVVNRSQLEESIRTKYGSGIEATKYLQKYISMWANLPISRNLSNSQRSQYLNYCLDSMKEDNKDIFLGRSQWILEDLLEHFNSSLREVERCLTNIALVTKTTGGDIRQGYAEIAIIVSVLKVTRPQFYEKLRTNKVSYSDVLAEAGLENMSHDYWTDKPEGSYVLFILKYCLADSEEQENTRTECKDYFRDDFDRASRVIPTVCSWLDTFSRR